MPDGVGNPRAQVPVSESHLLNRVVLGHGAVARLGAELRTAGVSWPLVVTDGNVQAAGHVDTAIRSMDLPPGVTPPRYVCTDFEPTERMATEAAAAFRDGRCDGIVVVAGGTPTDVAKAAAVAATHPGPLSRYTVQAGGMQRIRADAPPILVVPTTGGTGGEVSRGGMIVFADGYKYGVGSWHLVPKAVVADPELTATVPPSIAAGAAVDALSHGLEAVLSTMDHPIAETLALSAFHRSVTCLPRLGANGADPETRRQLMIAGIEGGIAFQKGLGVVHAMSHALGALHDRELHHGTLNAVLIPIAIAYYGDRVAQKVAALERHAGLDDGDFVSWFETERLRLGLPSSLGEMGVAADDAPHLAAAALRDHSSRNAPKLPDADEFEALFLEAIGG